MMLIPLECLVFSLFLHSVAATNCNPGGIYYAPSEICFSLSQHDADFYNARDNCINEGGNLASFHDDVMIEFLRKSLDGWYKYWIGGYYENSNWKWTDGTPFNFENWENNQPKVGDYIMMKGNGEWETHEKYTDKFSYICSSPALNQPTTIRPTTKACPSVTCPAATPCPSSNACPSTWTFYSDTQHCYTVFFSSSWDSSEELCQQLGGHMTSIHSRAENAFVSKLTRTYLNATEPLQMTWTGLSYEGGLWSWSDSSPVDFINWAAKEPVDTSTKKCAMISQDGSTQAWYTADCDSQMRAYVCKKRVSA